MINYVYDNNPIERAVETTVNTIKEHLAKGEKVLWLLTGGSGIAIAVEASKRLRLSNLSKLFVTITDERYGLVGHQDENWQQLLDAGFRLPGANLYRPLIGKDIEPTRISFNNWLSDQISSADYKIGIFGLGVDGHTAGIKPHSIAVSSNDLVTSYKADDFERVTITFLVIKQLNEVVIQASDKIKRQVIHKLITRDLPLDDQPNQILKSVPHATLYTNNKEDL